MRFLTLLLLTLLVQAPIRSTGVAGIVVISGKGTPLSKAVVVLQPEAEGRTLTAYTSTDGRFAFSDVPTGRYRISATRDGYFLAETGSADPTRCGTLITVDANRPVADVAVPMLPGGVIAGRIFERDGEPASNVTVEAIKYTYQNGNRVLTSVQRTKTNDLGEYRLFQLPPGRYLVAAALDSFAPRVMTEGFDDFFQTFLQGNNAETPTAPGDAGPGAEPALPVAPRTFITVQPNSVPIQRPSSRPGPRISPLYYPSSADPRTASPIEIRAGETFQGADLLVSRVEPRTIRGFVRNGASTDAVRKISVSLVSRLSHPGGGAIQTARVQPDGSFEVTNVLPGPYTLMAEGVENSGRALVGRLPIDVVGDDITNAELVVSRGISLSGRVTTDTVEDLARITGVVLGSISGERVVSASSLSAKVTDGMFTIDGIPPGRYMAFVTFTAPANIYVKSMRLGSADVRNGFSLEAQSGAALDIAVGVNAASLTGIVLADNGQVLKNATVAVVPDTFLRERSSAYKFTTTDMSGGFVIPSIAPGEYKVFAWESVETGAWEDPDFLRNYEARGQPVTLREGSRPSVQITALASPGTVYNACEPYFGLR